MSDVVSYPNHSQSGVGGDGGHGKPHEPVAITVNKHAGDGNNAAPPKACTKVKRPKSQATILIDLTSGCQKWHSPDGVGYISMVVDKHREHYPIKSGSFRRWLQREYYRRYRGASSAQAVQDAIGVLEGKALFDGREYPVYIRLAAYNDCIYIDLCDAAWRVVEIGPEGWRVLSDSPVKFRRCKAMLPLPLPVIGGDVGELRRQLCIRDEDWPLVAGWILSALRPRGPFPVLNLYAEQGAGKTTAARKIRGLIDPNVAPMRSEPKEPRDLMIAANNGWIIALDNLSHITSWMSDALCRLSTGGGFSTRELYSDQEEVIFDAQRPIIITGIEELATRSDLLDRSLIVTLPNIPEDQRRPESEIWREYDEARPRLLGVLYDAISAALRLLPTITTTRLPRMADFALLAIAGETAMGMAAGEFMSAYNGNRAAGNELALEASPVGKVLLDFTATTPLWAGTATELQAEMDAMADEKTKRLRAWPQSGRTLSGNLKRLAPNLRAAGVDVEFGTFGRGSNKHRRITIRRVGETSVPTVPIVPNAGKQGWSGDDGDANGDGGDAAGTQDAVDVTPYAVTLGTHGADGDAEIPSYSAEEDAAVEEFLRT